MKISRKRQQFFIAFIDALLLIISIYITLFIRNSTLPSITFFLTHLKYFWIVIFLWIISMYTMGLYSLDIPFIGEKVTVKLLLAASTGLFSGFTVFYLASETIILPKTVLVIYNVLSFLIILFWRWLLNKLLNTINTQKKIIFIGFSETINNFLEESFKSVYLNYTPSAVFDEDRKSLNQINDKLVKISSITELKDYIQKNNIKTFIFPEGRILELEVSHILFSELENGAHFYTLPDFYELLLRKIPLGAINETWFLRNISFDNKLLYHMLKRIFDIILSLLFLFITGVFWPFIALIIKIESKGPVFFTQIREGKFGKPFTLYKFRTMRTEENTFTPTIEGDNRITKFGSFIRKTRIDELPQILNVLKGDMSLIGPRPERPELSEELKKQIPFYRQRLMVQPGITGWDQVSGEYHSPSVADTYKKLQFDLYYIKNQSVFLDTSIFFKTIMTVFMKEGR